MAEQRRRRSNMHEGRENRPGWFRRFCERRRTSRTAVLLILALTLALAGTLGYLFFGNGGRAFYSSGTLDFGLRDMGELATQAGYYTNVNTIQKPDRTIAGIPIPGTSSRAMMTYRGVIRAGLDFEQISVKVDASTKTVTLEMPQVRILSNEIDLNSCEIYDEQNSIFNKINIRNYNESLSDMKEKSEKQALENDILGAARNNAETLIRSIIKNTNGAEEYSLVFRWKENASENEKDGG